jgi:hypothetical protein
MTGQLVASNQIVCPYQPNIMTYDGKASAVDDDGLGTMMSKKSITMRMRIQMIHTKSKGWLMTLNARGGVTYWLQG